MAEASNGERSASLEDQRMWRLLLARLHPDAGGDHELFLFACAVKEGKGKGRSGSKLAHNGSERKTEHFLRAWQNAMGCWALRNREALKNCRA